MPEWVNIRIFAYIYVLRWVLLTTSSKRVRNLAADKGQFSLSSGEILMCFLEQLYILFMKCHGIERNIVLWYLMWVVSRG